MAHIVIRDIGPIVEVEFELNRINVIIGPQSSGKSTIDKIACYCSWVEKRASQDQSFDFFYNDGAFLRELIRFHKIEGYLKPTSYIHYTSEVIDIEYAHSTGKLNMSWVDLYAFQNSKIAYIPAERNVVAAIPNWFDVKLFDNNTLNYMREWGESRQIHTKDIPFSVSGIDASYYYENGNDYVKVDGEDKPLLLTNTSSGYQSVIPLSVLFYYLTNWIYDHDLPTSFERDQRRSALLTKLDNIFMLDKAPNRESEESLRAFVKEVFNADYESEFGILRRRWWDARKRFSEYGFSKFFIEEPEQNLFPETQMVLLYSMLEAFNKTDRPHQLFITTHSPYILYALNNCILGGLLKDRIPEEILKDIACKNSFTDPRNVSVWEIKYGRFNPYSDRKTIQDEDGLIRGNYFDNIMKGLMKDFNSMLNFYEKEDE
jgi:predicted ATPase